MGLKTEKEKKQMTLIELQEKLGNQIEDITDERIPFENRKKMSELAMVVSSLAKQMVNNADVVLRAEKLRSEKKIEDGGIIKMINGGYVLMEKGEHGELTGKTV